MTLEELRAKRNRPTRKIKWNMAKALEAMYNDFIEKINTDPDYKQQCIDRGITVYAVRDVRSILGTTDEQEPKVIRKNDK
ncbi:hypothetical protein AGMMS49942_17960 [Spirochaetia bacterium]|nr:hypothetical protein AGMMS49942_17960 [Spirochaetia bacterium]